MNSKQKIFQQSREFIYTYQQQRDYKDLAFCILNLSENLRKWQLEHTETEKKLKEDDQVTDA